MDPAHPAIRPGDRPLPDVEAWTPWLHEVAAALALDSVDVPLGGILGLAGTVSSRFTRPMAPVAAFLWGYARGVRPADDPLTLTAAILSALPE